MMIFTKGKYMNFIKMIRKNELFQDFDDKEINRLFDSLKGRLVMKSKGMLIAKDDDIVTEFCIVLEGSIIEFNTRLDGTKEPVATIEQGGCFGLEQGYLPNNKLGFFVVAATDVKLLYLDIRSITDMCDVSYPCHQKLLFNVLRYLANRLSALKENNDYITTKGMRQKIAKLIYDKYLEQQTQEISLGMDRNEMAAFLNVSRPSMSREMMRMRDEGMFSFRKDKINILNLDLLTEVLRP